MRRESSSPGVQQLSCVRIHAWGTVSLCWHVYLAVTPCISNQEVCSSISSSPAPQISDFCLSCVLGGVHSKINTNLYGTVTHQPPETLKDDVVSYAGDVYAFGVLMWQVWGKVWRRHSTPCLSAVQLGKMV